MFKAICKRAAKKLMTKRCFSTVAIIKDQNIMLSNDYSQEDHIIEQCKGYSKEIQAFLQKRRITRNEVPPKIAVVQSPKQFGNLLKSQTIEKEFEEVSLNSLAVCFDNMEIDTHYIWSIFFDNSEFSLYKSILQKQILNGVVVHSEDAEISERISSQIDKFISLFHKGEEPSELEKVLEIDYLSQKHEKILTSKRYGEKIANVTLTDRECLKLLCKRDISIDFSKINLEQAKTSPREIFYKNSMITYIEKKHELSFITKKENVWRRFLKFLSSTDKSIKLEKLKTITFLYLLKIIFHMESEKFVSFIDTSFDFFINHFILCMHIWLIVDRLGNFSKNKFALDIKSELWSDFNNMASSQWTSVDTLRKLKKYKNLENHCKLMMEHLTWHFKIQSLSAENPHYKIDALVWQFIFNERVPRYDERVYRLSSYLVNNYLYLQSVNVEDLVEFNFDFNIDNIPRNFKDIILKYNPPMPEDEFLKEKGSNFQIKKYHYFYLNKNDKVDLNMTKTYVRYNLFERLNQKKSNVGTSRDPNELNYDEIKDETIGLQIEKELELIVKSNSNLTLLFWKIGIMKNLFNKLDKEEQERSKIPSETNLLKYLPNTQTTRFSETAVIDKDLREKLHKYRKNLLHNKKNALKPNYHLFKERILISPELNVSTKYKKRRPIADRFFNL